MERPVLPSTKTPWFRYPEDLDPVLRDIRDNLDVLDSDVDDIQTGALPIALAGIEGALGAYGPLQNMRAGVANVLDYGAVGDGVTDDTAAINAALATGNVYVPPGDYRVLGQLTVTQSRSFIEFAPGATIIKDGVGYHCFVMNGSVGTEHALTHDTASGSASLTLPSGAGAGFAVGDLVLVQSSAVVYQPDGKMQDIRKVMSVAGDVLTLDAPLLFDVLVSDSAKYAKVLPMHDISIINPTWHCPDPSTKYGFALLVQYGQNIRVETPTLHDMGGGIILRNVIDGVVAKPHIDTLRNGWEINASLTGYGYGVALAGSCSGILVDAMNARHTRHPFTTLSDQTSVSDFWGGPRDCIVRSGVSVQGADVGDGGQSHWDTHEFGTNIVFDSCIADGGGTSGFQARAKHVSIINGKTSRVGYQGVRIDARATDCHVINGEYAYSGDAGIGCGGARARVIGPSVHHNARSGVVLGADDQEVRGASLYENGTGGTHPYGVLRIAGVRERVVANIVPKSVNQSVGIHNLSATGIATNNIMPGFADPAAAFSSAHASSIRAYNITDADTP